MRTAAAAPRSVFGVCDGQAVRRSGTRGEAVDLGGREDAALDQDLALRTRREVEAHPGFEGPTTTVMEKVLG